MKTLGQTLQSLSCPRYRVLVCPYVKTSLEPNGFKRQPFYYIVPFRWSENSAMLPFHIVLIKAT